MNKINFVMCNNDIEILLSSFLSCSHNHRYERVFTEGERLFDRMVELQNRFVEWVALGVDDAERLGSSVLKTAEEWDNSLRQSKARGQQVVKLNWFDKNLDYSQ